MCGVGGEGVELVCGGREGVELVCVGCVLREWSLCGGVREWSLCVCGVYVEGVELVCGVCVVREWSWCLWCGVELACVGCINK